MVILSEKNSLINQFLSELRSVTIQQDSLRFRRNMERIGEIIAYELSKELDYAKTNVTTPLAKTSINLLQEQPVLASILRAGLPFHQGFLNYFDKAENAFIASYRNNNGDKSFEIKTDYVASPDLDGKTLIIADPMLATGKSLCEAYRFLEKFGKPKRLFIASIIASREGITNIQKNLPMAELYLAAVDEEMNSRKYIIPGLGDAGDLAFGERKK
ncbi:MAG: uracil phosphoribosyltransferase [Cytophagaceae bacterium]